MADILVIDSDVGLVGIIDDWLKFENHTVAPVHTGFEGWQRIRSNEYDIALLDWDLPDLDGLDVLKRFRQAGGNIPVIMLTRDNSVDRKEAALDAGANDCLTKPFEMRELSARIRAVLRNRTQPPVVAPALAGSNTTLLAHADLFDTALAAKYEFLDVIGAGTVGIIFKARHPHLDKVVAIKMIHESALSDDSRARCEREARLLSRLSHPNIPTVYDFGITERRQPYMVLEFIEGRALDMVLLEDGLLPLERAMSIAVQVAAGLAHAHEAGVVHRDVKPGNIMLKSMSYGQPIPKILDFGMAKREEGLSPHSIQLTQPGRMFGSPAYMSPEQVHAKRVDERSDVYSMGCVIFELATGSTLYDSDDQIEMMLKHINDSPRILKDVRPDLSYPAELQDIIIKALQKKPDDRFQTMVEFKKSLERVLFNMRTRTRD